VVHGDLRFAECDPDPRNGALVVDREKRASIAVKLNRGWSRFRSGFDYSGNIRHEFRYGGVQNVQELIQCAAPVVCLLLQFL
jgi:hypothetical protein